MFLAVIRQRLIQFRRYVSCWTLIAPGSQPRKPTLVSCGAANRRRCRSSTPYWCCNISQEGISFPSEYYDEIARMLVLLIVVQKVKTPQASTSKSPALQAPRPQASNHRASSSQASRLPSALGEPSGLSVLSDASYASSSDVDSEASEPQGTNTPVFNQREPCVDTESVLRLPIDLLTLL